MEPRDDTLRINEHEMKEARGTGHYLESAAGLKKAILRPRAGMIHVEIEKL